jgi:hypothetical protein
LQNIHKNVEILLPEEIGTYPQEQWKFHEKNFGMFQGECGKVSIEMGEIYL